jgi:hypothetical protein
MKFLIAFFGWLAWTLLILRLDKDHFDDQDKPFSFKIYALKNWDNWAFTVCAVFILGLFHVEDSLISALNHLFGWDLEWQKAYYLFGGFGFEILFYAAKKWKKQKTQE